MAHMRLSKYQLGTDLPLSAVDIKGDNREDWPNRYPQFMPTGANPLRLIEGNIFMMGQYFKSLPSNFVEPILSGVLVSISDETIEYKYPYPENIYGDGTNWEGGLQTAVYLAQLPDGREVLSYPPSHDILVIDNTQNKWIYGGSNKATAISSISKSIENTNTEDIFNNYLRQSMYGPIIYDPYRKFLYRFVSFPISQDETNTRVEEKEVGVIILNNELDYLGEVLLGKISVWNWNNSFVTKEGLNIEYRNNDDEDNLTFKILEFKVV